MVAGYVELYKKGILEARAEKALAALEACELCPWACGVDRTAGENGVCRTGRDAIVSSFGPHFGEERPLVGRGGSGTIFFASCNMRCLFCQNYDISQLRHGRATSAEELAKMMLDLQDSGCHNINFVTPSHVVAQTLEALVIAARRGLRVPLVYNTGGYDSLEALALLDGVVDIYMPDIKYMDAAIAKRLSGIKDYPGVVKAAVREMHRQVGDLVVDERGIAVRGLLVRHLVLPEGLAGTPETMKFLAQEVSRDTYVNVMDQYYPCYKAHDNPPLDRRVTKQEFTAAVDAALAAGLTRLDHLEPRAGRFRGD
ncbi:MAG: radical SAM protein [Actinomycetota bacterium]|nr:radical SAM protein [Actinomycetota bacterium]